MYESKKNSGRKDNYKYQKSSHQKNFHNTTHFGYHKYNKYKLKYTRSNSINDYDEESLFSQIFDENKSTKKTDLKEVDDLTPTPTIKCCKTLTENKENFSFNSNINEMSTQIKTNDINEPNELNNKGINEDVTAFNNSNSNNPSEKIIICEKEKENNDQENNNEVNNENINFNINNIDNINFNVENVINDLLIKNNEFFSSNEKENIHLEYKKNVYKTPQPFKANSSSSINISSNDMKEAYYVPKKLSTIYDMYATQQQPNLFDRRRNSINNFNFMTIQKPNISLSNKQIPNYTNLGISNNVNLNFFKNNNNNNFMRFNNGNNNISMTNNFSIPNSPNIPITSFNLFESNNINNIGNINNLPNLQQCLNHGNSSHHNLNKNPFHNMMPQLELNKCILKTQINNNNLFEKDKENTDILEINVKITDTETLTFKIRRYDDMFKTVKMFCEINKLDIKLIRPFIIYIIRALNSIYGVYNLKLKNEEIQFLKDIKNNFYSQEEEEDINEVQKEEEDDKKEDNRGQKFTFEDKGSIISSSKDNDGEDEGSGTDEEV